MLDKQTPMGVWSDEMPPVNLTNYPMKNFVTEGVGFPYEATVVYDTHTEQVKFNPKVGTKFDQDKPRMDLLDADYLEGVAQVLTFGANKYAAHNWRNGIAVSRLIASAYRHLGAINRGEDIDPESGLPHVYHLGCCTMFLSEMLKHAKYDNRYKK